MGLIYILLTAVVRCQPNAAARPDDELRPLLRQFTTVYQAVEEHFADPVVPEQAFYAGAIPGLLRTLDPFSAFLDPEQFQSLKQMQQSVEKGFGSVVSIGLGRVMVLQTLPGTPSARAGLSPGDEIIEINGYRIDRLEIDALVEVLRESRKREARLMVRRPGLATLMPFLLTPAELASPSVSRAFLLRPGIGYIKIVSFEQDTLKELQEALEKLGAKNLRGLVVDLRDNPGGSFPAALETASLFLQPGQVILTVRGRSGPPEEIKVPDTARPFVFPVAALTNGKTASAAEIVAGALQDHDRAAIVGEPSFGKGLVQRVFDLADNTGLALTTARYFTPSGRSIHRPLAGQAGKPEGGIIPDILVTPEGYTPFHAALEASASVLHFAQRYTSSRGNIGSDFEVTAELLDEFQLFLSERQIRPSLSEWSANREYIRNRLKTEIFNLALGVEKGDEVEAQRDPQIVQAIQALGVR